MKYMRVEVGTRNTKRIGRLARRLGIRRAEAYGLYVGLLEFAVERCHVGDMSIFHPKEVEDGVNWEGPPGRLMPALKGSGLVDEDGFIVGWLELQMPAYRRLIQDARRKKEKYYRQHPNAKKRKHRPILED